MTNKKNDESNVERNKTIESITNVLKQINQQEKSYIDAPNNLYEKRFSEIESRKELKEKIYIELQNIRSELEAEKNMIEQMLSDPQIDIVSMGEYNENYYKNLLDMYTQAIEFLESNPNLDNNQIKQFANVIDNALTNVLKNRYNPDDFSITPKD